MSVQPMVHETSEINKSLSCYATYNTVVHQFVVVSRSDEGESACRLASTLADEGGAATSLFAGWCQPHNNNTKIK